MTLYSVNALTRFSVSGGVKDIAEGKFCDFLLKSLFTSEMVRDRPMVIMDQLQEVTGGRAIRVSSSDLH